MNCRNLNLLIKYLPFIHFNRKVAISSFRNRLSRLIPMRKLGNTPRLLQFLTVLLWTCKRLAASPTVNKESFSSFPPLASLSAEYSVIGPSIPNRPFYDNRCLLTHHNNASFFYYPIINAKTLPSIWFRSYIYKFAMKTTKKGANWNFNFNWRWS